MFCALFYTHFHKVQPEIVGIVENFRVSTDFKMKFFGFEQSVAAQVCFDSWIVGLKRLTEIISNTCF